MDYVDKVYDAVELRKFSRDIGKGYYKAILETINTCRNLCAFDMDKSTAKHKMRGIVSYMIVPEHVYNSKLDEFTEAYHVLIDRKNHSFKERSQAKQFIEDHAVNLGSFDARTKERCNSLFEGLDYYTLDYKYEFDEDTMTGLGLTYYKDEESYFL